jgi:hypothetical protein
MLSFGLSVGIHGYRIESLAVDVRRDVAVSKFADLRSLITSPWLRLSEEREFCTLLLPLGRLLPSRQRPKKAPTDTGSRFDFAMSRKMANLRSTAIAPLQRLVDQGRNPTDRPGTSNVDWNACPTAGQILV